MIASPPLVSPMLLLKPVLQLVAAVVGNRELLLARRSSQIHLAQRIGASVRQASAIPCCHAHLRCSRLAGVARTRKVPGGWPPRVMESASISSAHKIPLTQSCMTPPRDIRPGASRT